MDILSNDWINMVMSKYSLAIAAAPAIIATALKVVAMLNPNVPTDKIRDLLTWKGKPWPLTRRQRLALKALK